MTISRTRLLVSKSLATAFVAALVLTGCAQQPQSNPSVSQGQGADDVLAQNGLVGLTGQEIVDRLDTLPMGERPQDMFASVRASEVVIIGADESETPVSLPDDQFYVSIAPFQTQTHDCYFHSLTTCVGEMQNQEIQVQIVNAADGTVLIDETTKTFDNGFVGYWLPRDITVTVRITADGKTSTADLATGGEDPTCVTTMQLT